MYVAFNAHGFAVVANLPAPAPGHKWARLVDTNLPPPKVMRPAQLAVLINDNKQKKTNLINILHVGFWFVDTNLAPPKVPLPAQHAAST